MVREEPRQETVPGPANENRYGIHSSSQPSERQADKVQLTENRELTVQLTENRRAVKMHASYGEQTGRQNACNLRRTGS